MPLDGLRSRAATHAGSIRKLNEDGFVDRPDLGLWAVADGAGGHHAGEIASGHVVAELSAIPVGLSAADMLAEVRQRLEAAHAFLQQTGADHGPRATCATTIVALLARGSHFACLWAGDSRAYLLRDAALTQITTDHSLVQELVDAGVLTEEEAERHPQANVITRAVGARERPLELQKCAGELLPGDRLLLCSDGLSKLLKSADLAHLLAEHAISASAFIAAALDRHAPDNVTAVVIEVP